MSIKSDKNSIINKLNLIKNINDNPDSFLNDLTDRFDKKSSDYVNEIGTKIENVVRRKDNKNDIFSELLNISSIIIESNKKKVTDDDKFNSDKLINYALIASKKTIDESNNIFLEEVKNIFFLSSDSICGTNKKINTDTINLSPKSFDFLNLLTINPSSINGKLLYEDDIETYKEKVNKKIYDTFNGIPYDFIVNDGVLFTLTWIPSLQQFSVTNLTKLLKNADDFLIDYYSRIEFFNIKNIINTCLGMTLAFDNKESISFNISFNLFNRVIKRITKRCGNTNDRDLLKNQTTLALFDENDEVETFDFDRIDDVNSNDEELVLNGVLKFTDCDNFEVKLSTDIIEDYINFNDDNNIDKIKNILNTINKASHDANEQQNKKTITIDLYYLNLIKNFILNMPKAIMFNIFTPKMFLPIVILYKIFKNQNGTDLNAKDIIKILSKLFNNILKKLFWIFIKEFWRLVKPELLLFVNKLVKKILKNKYKRYYLIITSLIKLLTKLLEIKKINNCNTLYSTILKTIELALNGEPKLKVPNIMLGFSDKLPGYSQDRAFMNIAEKLESAGISLSPIFGEENDLVGLVKSIIEGNSDEIDQNSFVQVTNKKITIPTPVGPLIIPPGLLNSTGKLM
jgi:hypothetical protein